MEQITARQALLDSNNPEIDKAELNKRVILTIKRILKGRTLFTYGKQMEDSKGRKITGVDAHRVYNPGRNNSYPVSELLLEDAITILSSLQKHYQP